MTDNMMDDIEERDSVSSDEGSQSEKKSEGRPPRQFERREFRGPRENGGSFRGDRDRNAGRPFRGNDRFDRSERGDRPERGFDRGGDRPERGFDRGERSDRGFDRGNRNFNRGEGKFERPFRSGPRSDFGSRPFGGPGRDRFEGGRPSFSGRRDDHHNNDNARVELPPFLKVVKSLHTEKGREKEGAFLAEGYKCVEEILKYNPEVIKTIYRSEETEIEALNELIEKHQIKVQTVFPRNFKEITTTMTTQGVIAECRASSLRPKWEVARYVTLLDSIQDPGNMGSIFRTSLAFGMDAVLLGKGCVDPFNPKVVRGSSGSFLRVPFENRVDLEEQIQFLRSKGFTIVATSPYATHRLDQIKIKKKVAFLVGNEGQGADNRLVDMCDEKVHIPMGGSLESLNVAVAHGILAFHLGQIRED